MSTALEMEAFLYGTFQPGARDDDVIAHALNESNVEPARNHHLITYSDDERLVAGTERASERLRPDLDENTSRIRGVRSSSSTHLSDMNEYRR